MALNVGSSMPSRERHTAHYADKRALQYPHKGTGYKDEGCLHTASWIGPVRGIWCAMRGFVGGREKK